MSTETPDLETAPEAAQEAPEAKEPPIILLGLGGNNYYLYKGDEFLDDILLVDGEYPKPILCVNFESIFDAKRVLGEGFSTTNHWAVHPEVVARLRNDKVLVETDA